MGGKQVQAMGDSVDPGRLADAAGSILGGLFGVLSDVFFIITLLLFLIFDDARTHLLLADARRQRPNLVDALSGFAQGTRTYLGVSAGFGFIVAIIDWVVLWAMGIPGAFAWGVLAFVTNFVPNIGFVIGVIPPALIGLLEGGPKLMLAVIAVYSVINFVIQSCDPAQVRRQRRRALLDADLPVAGVLDLGPRSAGCSAGGAHEPAGPGHPGRCGPGGDVADTDHQREARRAAREVG